MSNENYKINKRIEGDTEIIEIEMLNMPVQTGRIKKTKFNKLINKHYE